MRSELPELDASTAAVIGDDPWSDAAFAEQCGLRCWIVDRDDRYRHVRGAHRRVATLNDIPVVSGGSA